VHSVSEKTGNTYTGICVQKKKENSLLGSFRVIAGVAGGMVNFLIKLNSPLLTDFKVLKKGDGKARSHLIKYWKSEFSAQQLKQPRIKQTRKKSFIQTRVPKNIKGIVFDPLELPKTPEPGQE
jgi:ribosomal protein L19